jgi:integrase
MTTVKIPEKKRREKPAKPYPDFPLFPHRSGQWAKVVRRRTRYFGVWEDWQAALDKWLEQKDALLGGREPAANQGGMTLGELVKLCVVAKRGALQAGELAPRTLAEYCTNWKRVVELFGAEREVATLGPADFSRLRASFATSHGPVALTADVRRAMVLFNWGHKNYDILPKFGTSFDKPSRAVMRKARAARAKKLFLREEVLKLLKHADLKMRAMIFLGINCAFSNDDCAKLTLARLDLDGGWHHLPRNKTGIQRDTPLWPETVEALRAVVGDRPRASSPELEDRVFLTLFGNSFEGSQKDNPISKQMAKLMGPLGLHKKGRGFNSLRHTFKTQAKRTRDGITVEYIMGHADEASDMDDVYNEEVCPEDLKAVTDFVRAWLIPPTDSELTASDDVVASGPLRLYAPETLEETLPSRDTVVAGNRAG